MTQKVADAAFGYGGRAGGNRAAAGKLGRDEYLARFFRYRIVHADSVDLDHPHGERCRKGFDGRKTASFLCCVGQGVCGGIRQEIERSPTGMKIHDDIGCGQKVAGEIIGNLFCDGAIRAPRKTAVEVALVNGDVRVPARKAGKFIAGTMMTRPLISSGFRLAARS